VEKVSKIIKHHLLIHEPSDSHAYNSKKTKSRLLTHHPGTVIASIYLVDLQGGTVAMSLPHKEHVPTTLLNPVSGFATFPYSTSNISRSSPIDTSFAPGRSFPSSAVLSATHPWIEFQGHLNS